uniref:Uncharacterized protein n=1 Tax=viral metagenome TaxID=1070528 RepID=A0A6C0I6P4_9ZZZZ
MELLWISLLVGLGVGMVVSFMFGMYSKSTTNLYARSLFGISSSDLIMDGLILILGAGFFFLSIVSIMVRDSWYPINYPLNFSAEVLLMAFVPALVFLLMCPLRGYPITWEIMMEFAILVVKFGALQVVLQFSGFYSSIFPPKI